MFYHPSVLFHLLIAVSILSAMCCSPDTEKKIGQPVKRIISLSPSITGQIIDLEAEDLLAGVTPFHPPLKKEVPTVGTYIAPSIEKIISLKPDIIFMSEEDGEIQRNSFFEKFGLTYYRFGRNRDFKSICDNYGLLAGMIGRSDAASAKIDYYKTRLGSVRRSTAGYKTVFLVSVKPLITVSDHSHISDIIRSAGGVNVFNKLDNPYPILTLESLVLKNPDVVIVMTPGDDQYLYHQLRKFKTPGFISKKNIFVSGYEVIPYYTPKEYVLSVEKIADIYGHVNK